MLDKKFLLGAILTAAVCFSACSKGDAEILETTAETTSVTPEITSAAEAATAEAAEKLSGDISVSREYEFDLDKYLRCDIYDRYLLRDKLDFFSDEQYDTYIRALILLDRLEYFDVPYTGSLSTYFIDENGEISESGVSNESGAAHIYPYFYVSTYQSFYEYLQSVFTQDAADEIMSSERFLTIGGELYFKWGDRGGSIYFNGGEYVFIEGNDSEIVFEYIADQVNGESEWQETHPLRLVHTDNGWRSEFFENLYIEKNV